MLVLPLFRKPFFIPAKLSLFCVVAVGTSTELVRLAAGMDEGEDVGVVRPYLFNIMLCGPNIFKYW